MRDLSKINSHLYSYCRIFEWLIPLLVFLLAPIDMDLFSVVT